MRLLMRKHILSFALTGAVVFTQQTAFADHNSPFGEGWARMPNDIHNTRIDTLGDNTTFRDFVRYGNGSDSVNRYSADSDYTRGARGGLRGGGDYGSASLQRRGGGRAQGRGRGR
jgi:hypothetical protein